MYGFDETRNHEKMLSYYTKEIQEKAWLGGNGYQEGIVPET